jgi:hypothetical protein
MSTEQEKAEVELAVFRDFISKAGISIDPRSVSKPGTQSEPDIFCTLSSGEQVAYELVEICSSDIAAALSKITKGGSTGLATSDPTEKTLRHKLHKTYRTTLPIELLCYTNGRTVSPDDLIFSEAQRWANTIDGPFRKVWLLGEKGVYEVWTAS